MESLQLHPSGSNLLILFPKPSRLLKFFISIGTIRQTFEAKSLIEFRSSLQVLTEFLKRSYWVRRLHFINLCGKMLLSFSFILYSSIARLWIFLWWILKKWSFCSTSWNELMVSLYTIRTECSCKWLMFLFMKHPMDSSGQ